MLNSSFTGRAPRSMASAFNPYCDNVLHPMPSRKTTPLLVRFIQRLLGVNK